MKRFQSELAKGVFLSCCQTDKFKSSLLTVSLVLPLDEKTASGYSLLTNLLSLSTKKYPTMQSLATIKDELYSLELEVYVRRKGEALLLTFELATLSEKYAFDGEKILERGIELLGEAIFAPLIIGGSFDSANTENEKRCLIDEIESLVENKPAYAMRKAQEIMCAGEPFAVDAAGRTDFVKAIDGTMLADYYEKAICTSVVHIVYTGAEDLRYVEDCVRRYLPFPARYATLPQAIYHPVASVITRVTERMDVSQCMLVIGFQIKKPSSIRERVVLSVYDELLGGSPTSKLFVNVREKRGLCYFCSSHPTVHKNVFFVSCGVEASKLAAAEQAIFEQTENMKSGDFTQGELETAVASLKRSLRGMDGSIVSLNSFLGGQLLFGDGASPSEYEKLLDSVTVGDIVSFAETVVPDTVYTLEAEAEE